MSRAGVKYQMHPDTSHFHTYRSGQYAHTPGRQKNFDEKCTRPLIVCGYMTHQSICPPVSFALEPPEAAP